MSTSYIRKEVLAMPGYHVPFEEQVIKLNQNESPWDIPAAVKGKVAERFLAVPLNRYTETEPVALKKKLAQFLGVTPEHLVIANGSNVLVQAIMLATAIGRKVMTLTPTFSVYRLESQLLANQLLEVPLNADFTLDADRVVAALKGETPQVLFIANPNAPTGNLFDREDLVRIIEAAPCPVVVDEAYFPFSEATLIDQVERLPNLIILRTFSKAFAMAGARLGYLITNPAAAAELSKVLLPFCVSAVTQIAAEVILEDAAWVKDYVDKIVGERERLYEEMAAIRGIHVFPSQANFILFKVQGEVDANKTLFHRLLAQKVLVRDVSDAGALRNCLRVSVGTAEENAQFIAALKKNLR